MVVALDEDMARRLAWSGAQVEIIRPWVFLPVIETLAHTPEQIQGSWTWIYSGNLGRAHEWQTLLD